VSDTAFQVRLAEPDEFAQIGDITVRGYVNDGLLSDSDFYADRLRDVAARAADSEVWVAVGEPDGRLLGSVTFCPVGSASRELATETEGEFRMLAVDPDARGLGVGRALVEQCLRRGRELGFDSVVLCSLPMMGPARGLYSALGFERDPGLDWSPVDDVLLEGFRISL
jgi:ribosomal protein S18 acetylase RimI-like enzyme